MSGITASTVRMRTERLTQEPKKPGRAMKIKKEREIIAFKSEGKEKNRWM